MADHSTIEWTDATWNPITGCSIVSPGCTNCYAMKLAGTRLKHIPSREGLTRMTKAGPVWTGEVRLNEQWLDQPLKWKRPRKIFVCAHGDLFAENVPDEWIDKVFAVMALTPHHTFQVLTKRAERMRRYLTKFDQEPHRDTVKRIAKAIPWGSKPKLPAEMVFPLPNVWLGISAERQQEADERIPHLLATPAAIRFVSAEPLLGPIDFYKTSGSMPDEGHPWRNGPILQGIHWIIVGGESGQDARPMHPDWARSVRDQCAAAGVAFHFKQWGAWGEWNPACPVHPYPDVAIAYDGRTWDNCECIPYETEVYFLKQIGKKRAGRLLDGVEHNGFPEALV